MQCNLILHIERVVGSYFPTRDIPPLGRAVLNNVMTHILDLNTYNLASPDIKGEMNL
jgi:hypothetical protein